MSEQRRLQVSLITGFLGSGKTTLLSRIVASPAFKAKNSALLINDAGPVNIDAKIFKGKAQEIKAVTGGCVCCVNPEEMRCALLEFYALPEIQHVWIEASGVAETDEILDRLMDHPLPQRIVLQEIIHVVDAENFPGWFYDGFGQKHQIALANRVLINKVDLVKPAILQKIIGDVKSWNPLALVQPTIRCNADFSLIPPSLAPFSSLLDPQKRSHSEWKTRWIPFAQPQSLATVECFLRKLPESVYRAKGFIRITEHDSKTHFIQKVGPHAETVSWEYEGSAPEHGLVLLGRGEEMEKIRWEKT
jgi:G3E family GTPase